MYLTAGLPMDTARWVEQWPVIMRNVIDACAVHSARLVYFDNTYMYPQTSEAQSEEIRFEPNGDKGKVRAQIANELLLAMESEKVNAVICRAPEFYGPGKTQSITNATILNKFCNSERASVFISDNTLRTLIYTPDASQAMALIGNTDDAYGQTWHLPCDDNRMTYKHIIALSESILGRPCHYRIVKQWQLKLAGLFNRQVRDAQELLPRYYCDNLFVSDKFKTRFPTFKVTPYSEGLRQVLLQETSGQN